MVRNSICEPPGMYREAAATTTPQSTSRAEVVDLPRVVAPSAIVTTATGAPAASMQT